ncbi:hypothetical protein DP202_16735 [Enterobacter cloacae]|uniref:Uncharacterized protein n=1 Tax=Enterobacter cloacae TaxID=550 RepID=A0A330G7W7_ENTCL|nr:hypothetical protein DP202_16735 [Enterobacter cloacae]
MFPLTPALSLKGEGVVRAGIILWGSLRPRVEGINTKNGNLRLPFCFDLEKKSATVGGFFI